MNITRVIFKKPVNTTNALALCDIVLEDCLRICDIRLYKKDDYYLVFPSKQDVYQMVSHINKGKEIQFPSAVSGCSKGKYEEFYYPVQKEFYIQLLDAVKAGYKDYKGKGTWSYVP